MLRKTFDTRLTTAGFEEDMVVVKPALGNRRLLMKPQATRINPQRAERLEVFGCVLALLLCMGVIAVFYRLTWSIFS